jgi:hypothetical protein
LTLFSQTFEREKSTREISQVKRAVVELEKRTHLVLEVKEQLEGKTPAAEMITRVEAPLKVEVQSPPKVQVQSPPKVEVQSPPKVQVQSPPGCIVNARALHLKGHYFTKSSPSAPSRN